MDTLFIIKYKNIVDIWWTPVFSEQLKKWGYPQKFYPGEYPRFFWTTEIVGATPIFAISLLFLFGDFIRLRHPARKSTISYFEMKNGLQSVFCPFEPSFNMKNKNRIFQSIFSLLNFTTHAMRQTLTASLNND